MHVSKQYSRIDIIILIFALWGTCGENKLLMITWSYWSLWFTSRWAIDSRSLVFWHAKYEKEKCLLSIVRACPALQGRGWNIPAPAISFPIGEEVVYSNISAPRDTSATRSTANTAQCVHLSAATDVSFLFQYCYPLNYKLSTIGVLWVANSQAAA